MNILEIIKKAPKDHVYYCTIFGDCNVEIIKNTVFPITVREVNNEGSVGLTKEGKYFDDCISGGECILFPSRDNRDWEAFERELPLSTEIEFEGGGRAVFNSFCDISGINLDHEYYKNHPYIDFQIDGKEYKVSTEDMKRLALGNADNKTEHISGQSFDGTAEIVNIPDRPMMAAVIMSGMLARGSKDKGETLVNRAVRLADMILEETEDKTKEE